MKPKVRKLKKTGIPKKTKLERILFEESISMKQLQEGTSIAYPTLFNLVKGRTTSGSTRTIRDLEIFLNRPAEEFLGFEGQNVPQKTKE